MYVCHLRCTSSVCSGKPDHPKHCRANIVVHHRRPVVLPKQGELLSEETRSQLIALLPYLCAQANPNQCALEVAMDPDLSNDAIYLLDSLCDVDDPRVAFHAKPWLEGIVRGRGPVAEVVTAALRERSNEDAIDLVLEGANRLWATKHTYSLN